jgi:hypothetical protein
LFELLTFQRDLQLEHFTLHAHAHELANGHAERPSHEASDARQHHNLPIWSSRRDTDDQAGVGHEAIVDTEDGRP